MLKLRVVTALVLLAVLVPILFFLPAVWANSLFALIAALAAWEWSRLASFSRPARILFPIWILACCGLCLIHPPLQLIFCMLAAGFWLLALAWLAWRWPLPKRGLIAFLVGTLLLVAPWIGMVHLQAIGPWALLATLALVWVADISAYFVGRAFGRHKLAPAISPGKTWEGAIGAATGGLLYAYLLQHYADFALPANWLTLAFGTVLLVAFSIIGDLFESMIKRQAGVKDSSNLLPGHGGVLDRIDSLTSTLPLVVLGLYYFQQ